MNTEQLIQAIGNSLALASPPQEYCFLWINSWGTCMTKSEWSAWVQAFAVLVALGLPFVLKKREKYESLKRALQFHGQLKHIIFNLTCQLDYLDGTVVFSKLSEVKDVIASIRPIHYRAEFLTSLSGYDNKLSHRLLLVADGIEENRQVIFDCIEDGTYDDNAIFLTENSYEIFNCELEKLIVIERELQDLSLIINPKEIYEKLHFMQKLKFIKDRFFIYLKC